MAWCTRTEPTVSFSRANLSSSGNRESGRLSTACASWVIRSRVSMPPAPLCKTALRNQDWNGFKFSTVRHWVTRHDPTISGSTGGMRLSRTTPCTTRLDHAQADAAQSGAEISSARLSSVAWSRPRCRVASAIRYTMLFSSRPQSSDVFLSRRISLSTSATTIASLL